MPDTSISCLLTTPEFKKRKEGIIDLLKGHILDREELPNGYAYQFDGTDEMITLLVDFIKSERQCCPFFDFQLSVAATGTVWLQISGPEGAKELLRDEISL